VYKLVTTYNAFIDARLNYETKSRYNFSLVPYLSTSIDSVHSHTGKSRLKPFDRSYLSQFVVLKHSFSPQSIIYLKVKL